MGGAGLSGLASCESTGLALRVIDRSKILDASASYFKECGPLRVN